MRRLAALGLVVTFPVFATPVSLSGTVTDKSTQGGIAGVKVSLLKAGLYTTTLSGGSWSLSGEAMGILGRRASSAVATSPLSLLDGHVYLRYEGHDLLGHVQAGRDVASVPTAVSSRLSVAAATVDTLLFAWKDTVRLRVPLTSYVQTGLVSVVDTSGSTVQSTDTGHFRDVRDGQTYKYVKIGSQTWMAQNLNYTGTLESVGACYDGLLSNCARYGRLYTWAEVMAGSSSSITSPSGVQGICPSGWHVPSDTEWGTLLAYVGSDSARIKLSSTSGWSSSINGTDKYGFNILPAGYRYDIGSFRSLGDHVIFWSSSEFGASRAWFRSFGYGSAYVIRNDGNKSYGFSLRCAEN
jgi:uncharacterized protein (TIGR02145 family)